LLLEINHFQAKNQMLQGKVEILELKAENHALNLKEAAENNESFQHPQTKGIFGEKWIYSDLLYQRKQNIWFQKYLMMCN
jgi:predicted double-glycine peptidase